MSYNFEQVKKLIQSIELGGGSGGDSGGGDSGEGDYTPLIELSDAIDSDSSTTVATSRAVKIVNDKIDAKWEAKNATPTVKGIVSIGDNIKVESGRISVAEGSTDVKGVVQLSNEITSTDKQKAATSYALNRIYKLATRVRYELCEVYYFLNPKVREGFVPAYGGIIANANMNCPDAWEFLLTEEGQQLCCAEEEWQRLSTTRYYQKENGEWEGWNGIGGVTKFVINVNRYTIRVPDLRGMYPEAIGLSYNGVPFEVGDVHPDMIRNIFGHVNLYGIPSAAELQKSGALRTTPSFTGTGYTSTQGTKYGLENLIFDSSKTIPCGDYTAPRSYGVIPLVYMGV